MSVPHPRRALAAVAAVAALATLAALAAPLAAQARERQPHGFDSAEGRLLGFYSATLLFTPLAVGGATPRLAAGVELGAVPRLTARQRAIGTDKPENTNLAPVFPRPRVAVGLPGGLGLEASWQPPVKVFGVTANLVNLALSAPLATIGGVGVRARVAAPWGTVTGAITCSADVARDGDRDLATYYATVCHGRDSEDHFQPRSLLGELLLGGVGGRAVAGGRLAPWATVGARREWTRFDIGVIRDDGTRDPDHPILELHGTRAHGSLGAAWTGPRHLSLSAEALYVPGSLATARVYAGLRR